MPKGCYEKQRLKTEDAKAALHPLPVVENGVPPVVVASVQAIYEAALTYARDCGGTIYLERRAKASASWIAYRCTDFSSCAIGRMTQRNPGATNRDIARIEASLRIGIGNVMVDGILKILVERGHTKRGHRGEAPFYPNRPKPEDRPKRAREPKPDEAKRAASFKAIDPRWLEAEKLRGIGWAYRGIAKRTGLPEADVAAFCGVELIRVNA